jgi:hypothetical protein
LVSFGSIKASQIAENEFRIAVLERIVERLVNGSGLDDATLATIRENAIQDLQKKYPDLDMHLS